MQSDQDLAQRFSAERGVDERRVPAFTRVLARRRSSARLPLVRLAMAGAVVVVAVAVATWEFATPNEPIIAFEPGDMRVPTDFLLETVRYPRAGDIPRIGTSDLLPSFTGDGSDTRRLP